MIFRLFSRFSVCLAFLSGLIVLAWVVLSHRNQPPLPRLLFSHNDMQTLYLWQIDCPLLATTCQREQKLLEGLNLHPVAQWSPDGAYIAVYMAEAWMIYRADCLVGNQNCTPVPLDATANDTRIAWGPGGSTIAYMTSESETTLNIRTRGCWDGSPARTCLTRTIQVASYGAVRRPAWSADGGRLVFLGLQPRGFYVLETLCLDDAAGCTDQVIRAPVNVWPVDWPSLSADGERLLYFAETPDGVEQLYITRFDPYQTQQISFHEGGGNVPAWSSDERYIAYAGFQERSGGDLGIYILDVERGMDVLAISRRGQDLAYPAWSPSP